MSSVNKVILIGRLGADPAVETNTNGLTIAKLSIATSSIRKNEHGDRIESTEWHKVAFFGRFAELCSQYLRKGSNCYVEGRIKTDRWEDDHGQKHSRTYIVGENLQFLDKTER